MHIYAFEKLEVWQEARVFSVFIYQLTASFPNEEKFGLVSQLRRGAISVASNIAEGSARKSGNDQAHFYQMAYSSLVEVTNHLIISHDLKFISSENLNTCRKSIESISNKLNALRNSVLTKIDAHSGTKTTQRLNT